MKPKNRRKNAMTRMIVQDNESQAFIFQGRLKKRVQLVDISSGGIGIIISTFIKKELELKIGQKVRIQFFLARVSHVDLFIVRTINGDNRVGLAYADGQHMSPRQRVLAGHNTQKQMVKI